MQQTVRANRQIRWENILSILSVIVLVVTFTLIVSSWNDTLDLVGSQPYTVQYGDTLWEIAEKSNGYGKMDIRDIIYDIKELSDCTTTINYGQTVQIPIYEED